MTRKFYGRSRGLSYLDVIVAIAIIVVVVAFLLPVRRSTGDSSWRVKCASNLRQIGQGLLLYSNENKGAYPRVAYDESVGVRYFTGVNDDKPFDGKNDPLPNDVTAALFLLVRTQDMGTEIFTCPSSDDERFEMSKPATSYSNFPDGKHLSYAITVPYYPKSAAEKGYRWNNNVGPEFAIGGDKGTGNDASKLTSVSPQSETKPFNSKNHDGDGQNVLYGDGHVEFQNTPFCGEEKDFIYGPSAGKNEDKVLVAPPGVVPQSAGDSILLPTDRD